MASLLGTRRPKTITRERAGTVLLQNRDAFNLRHNNCQTTDLISRATPPHRQNQLSVALFASDRSSETGDYIDRSVRCQGREWSTSSLQILASNFTECPKSCPPNRVPNPTGGAVTSQRALRPFSFDHRMQTLEGRRMNQPCEISASNEIPRCSNDAPDSRNSGNDNYCYHQLELPIAIGVRRRE